MEKEVGGGIGMGNTCKPMAVSFQCMIKSTTIIIIIIIKSSPSEVTCLNPSHPLFCLLLGITGLNGTTLRGAGQ